MRSLHTALISSMKPHRPRLIAVVVIVNIFFWAVACFGANYLEEERLDSAAGILDREWRINLIRLATRDYLRTRSQIKTGLPNYDQLLENTRLAPALLYDQLTATPTPAVPSTPAGSSSSAIPAAPSTPAGSSSSATPGSQQGAPSSTTDNSTPSTTPALPLPDLNPPLPTLPPGAPTPTLPPPSGPGPSVIP